MVESLPPNEPKSNFTSAPGSGSLSTSVPNSVFGSEFDSVIDSRSQSTFDSGATSYTHDSNSLTRSENRRALFEIREFKATALTSAEPVNLLIYEQDRILLRGPSGSGKSLFLRALAGLRPSVGTAKFAIKNSKIAATETNTNNDASNGQLLYLAQNPVFISGTVEENLKLPLSFKSHQHRTYPKKQIEHWLKEFGFDQELLTREAKLLSGGEKQIVHLIRGLILDPNLLLLDEPTASLDQTRAQAVEEFLKIWVQEKPMRALILVTHERSNEAKVLTKPEFVRL